MFFSIVLIMTVLFGLQPATTLALSSSTYGPQKPERVAAAYFAGWHATGTEAFPLSAISWNKYNTLIYAFAATTPSVHEISLEGSNPSLLPDFVDAAHEHGVAAHISPGGWTGSMYFSTNVASPENRTAFVKTLTDFVERYGLDGISLDWEFPGSLGLSCNTVSPNDTQNFLSFLLELRAHPVGANLTLSAATTIKPFTNAAGKPSVDVHGFADVLDYIVFMDYDISGTWMHVVGPNSPLNDECAPPDYRVGSAFSAVEAWTKAGMPLDKIVVGVAAYGHSYHVDPLDAFVKGSTTELAPYPKLDASKPPTGDAWSDPAGVDPCGVFGGPGGTFTFWGLVANGFLTTEGEPAPGIYYRFDNCSQTPFVYNKMSEVMVAFDDAQAYAAKGEYIKEIGLRGFAMWEAGGDYHDILLDSIRESAEFISSR